ncbi:MAG TPA: UDP-N-acetylmuramoyl-L-alanyl-D-glutamate--2,6-diaminopimelate ligase [Myxococcota bacterium]
MKLRALFAGIAELDAGVTDLDVVGVTVDSRKVKTGVIFVAAAGATPGSRDGHDFADTAVAAGAPLIVAARSLDVSVPVVLCADPRRVAAQLAERLAGAPSSSLKVCGVTGTNGKTTVTTLLAQIADVAGRRGAVVGTLGIGPALAPRSTGFTTPEAEQLAPALRQLVDDGVDIVGMEVSSHAIDTRRADGVDFAAVAFTNLSRDHLDFHGTLEAYFVAKQRLFTTLAGSGIAVVPASDDEHGFHARLRRPGAWTWGIEQAATVTADDVVADADGLRFTLVFSPPGGAVSRRAVRAPALLGRFNVENAVVAAALALAVGVAVDDVVAGLATAQPPRGRMQRVPGPDGSALVVVDYAHTPDALERALLTARDFTNGRLFVVFGCGGDRDPGKRRIMGRVANDVADVVVVTDDNPRSENSADIIDAILGGMTASRIPALASDDLEVGTWRVEPNRRIAIRAAIRAAGEGDTVVIAGKGHEREQKIGTVTLPFDDVDEAAAALRGEERPAFLPKAFIETALGSTFRNSVPDILAGVSTDSRRVGRGSLFVALRGDSFDGHAFVEQAIEKGAAAALVEAGSSIVTKTSLPLIVVDDALAALQQLAHRWLQQQPAVRIGLTGSNGKTTTKELVAAALRFDVGHDAVLATEGNLNNHIGLPLTALNVDAHHRFAVLEMGMNHLAEIEALCAIARPTIGLVTNMGTAHAGNVGGVEGVAKAKAELFEALPATGIAVVNADDARCVREAASKVKGTQLFAGTAAFADVRLTGVVDLEAGGQRLTFERAGDSAEVSLPLDGRHNAVNAALAVGAAVAVGVGFAVAVEGLSHVHHAHGRLERRRRSDGLLVLDDSYNANPDSMEAGLETLSTIAKGRATVAVLGEMLELGEQAEAAHKHIGAAAAQAGISMLFACGRFAAAYAEGARNAGLDVVVTAADSTALAPLVATAVTPSQVVLVKGSRGARMERVLAALFPAKTAVVVDQKAER